MPRYEVRSTTDDEGEDAFIVWDTKEGIEVDAFWHQDQADELAAELNTKND